MEALPAKLVVHFGRHTNHTAADQPFAASKQDNHDAEETVSKSSLKHDHQKRGDDESTFEHVHVPLVKNRSRFLEQMMQQKHVELRMTEIMNKSVHQPSRSLQMDILCGADDVCFHDMIMISLTLFTHVLFESRIGCDILPTMTLPINCFLFLRRSKNRLLS